MPYGLLATCLASPPAAGSSQSAAWSSSGSVTAGSGRLELNSTPPSGRNVAADSPGADRVSRRAARTPAGSSSHSALTYFLPSADLVATEVTSREPSVASAKPDRRGSEMYLSRSPKFVSAASDLSSVVAGVALINAVLLQLMSRWVPLAR